MSHAFCSDYDSDELILTETPQPAATQPSPNALRVFFASRLGITVTEFAVMLAVSAFFLLFGLTPLTGGDQLGLVGADEPRYAQIAREMLAAHSEDCHAVHSKVTPHSLRPADLHAAY